VINLATSLDEVILIFLCAFMYQNELLSGEINYMVKRVMLLDVVSLDN
jgi:hypothetical protein